MPSKSPRSRNTVERMQNASMSLLRSKAKALKITNWQRLSQEDLEFFVREWALVKKKEEV